MPLPIPNPAGVDIYLFDESAPLAERFLYFHSSRPRKVPREPEHDQSKLLTGVYFTGKLHVGRRRWLVICKPSPEFLIKGSSYFPWFALIAGLVFTGLLVGYIQLLRTGRAESESLAVEQIKARKGLEREVGLRKQAEEELQKERNKAQNYLDVAEVIIVALNRAGEVTMMNRKGVDLLGYSHQEILGWNWFDTFIPERDRNHIKKVFSRVFAGELELVRYIENSVLTKSGDERLMAWYNTLLTDPEGNPIGTLSSGSDITERKKAETALRQSEEMLERILTASPVGITCVEKGRIRWANRSMVEMFGYEHEKEYIQKYPKEFYSSKQEYERVREIFFGGIAEGKSISIEAEFKKKDGSLFHGHLRTSVADLSDDKKGIISTIVDITERKRAENALRESEEFNRILVEIAPVGILYLDSAGTFMYANRTSNRILGVPEGLASPAIGKSLYEMLESKGEADVVAHFRRLLDGHPIQDLEFTFRSVTGKEVSLSVAGAPRHRANGAVAGAVVMCTDISERKKQDEVRLRLATAIEQAAESVIITDNQGTILYVNPSFELTTGYGREEVLGRNPRFLKSGKQDEMFYKHMWETLLRGEVWAGRVINKKKDGTLYEEDGTISPVKDKSGKIINYVAVKRDVTGEVLLQEQVQQAQRMESIGTLAGGIAHDFNNLLTIVLGYSELLILSKDKKSPGCEEAQAIHQAAARGADLVKQILTFSRRTETHPRPINLNNEVKQTEKLLYRTIPKMIEIELHLAADLKTIRADSGEMEQILLNLAVNARDAMPTGGRLIIETRDEYLDEEDCRMHLDAKPGEYVVLIVSDTGCGMSKDVMDHIFEPFYTTKKVGDGTGLGLAMVYGIVKGHGGHITCYSEPGAGTTLKIYFPTLETEETPDLTTTQQIPAFGTETILVVDDEELIRDLARRILSKTGYTVLAAGSGEEALEIYRNKKDEIALVILDLIMAGMGGRQCLDKLLEIDPKTKILVASGYSASGPAKEAVEAGARGFVDKPFQMRHLLRTVREILDE